MKRYLLLAILMVMTLPVMAQYNINENKIWAFGDSTGIDLTTGTPIPFTSSIRTGEGSASVCDKDGRLLFYTDGVDVYNRLHTLMPSGNDITTILTGTTTQGALIVPKPGSPFIYYIFSLGYFAGYDATSCHLVYSVVDMMADGGLGDVVASDIHLADTLSEKLVSAIGSNGCNIWVLTRKRDTSAILAYNVDHSGVSTVPVVSYCGSFAGPNCYNVGVLKVSPDQRKIVSQSMAMGTRSGTELYDFNPFTGIVSNCQVLDSIWSEYGAEFSPDGSKLYTQSSLFSTLPGGTMLDSTEIAQYDIGLPTVADMRASRTVLAAYHGILRRDPKLGPDGKVYLPGIHSWGFLDRIEHPDVAGTACGYTYSVVGLTPHLSTTCLPNTVVKAGSGMITGHTEHVNKCAQPGETITLTASDGLEHIWYDGTTAATHAIGATGTYWAWAITGCAMTVDTFFVTLDTFGVHLGSDTIIHHGETIVLSEPPLPAGWYYVWSTGSVGDSIHITEPGVYWLVAGNELCRITDTIVVARDPADTTTGVAGMAMAGARPQLSVFPNPAGNSITVAASGCSGTVTISCYNITGARVFRYEGIPDKGKLNFTIDTRELPNGIYAIKLQDDTGAYLVQDLVMQR